MEFKRRMYAHRSIGCVLALVLAMMSALQTPAFAQVETGQIAGVVSDPQGAVVAGAAITATSKDTGAVRTTTSTGDGAYIIPNLQPGNYEIAVAGQGFATKTIPVRVSVGTKTSVDVELAVSGGGETVDIVAGEQGVQVNTDNQTLSTIVTEKQIRELPTLSRNPYALVQLAGTAVTIDPEAQDPNTTASDRGVGFNINGQRSASTNVLLDGADNNDTYASDIGNAVPLDSVQEFSVLTNNFSAEYGRAGGGIVNVATKGGTNEYHGTVYEFNRVSALATSSAQLNGEFVPTKKGVFTRNQFGYSVGGPIIKDKLLFFQSTEWLRIRSADTAIALVPTPELIAQTPANVQAFFAPFTLSTPINGQTFRSARSEGIRAVRSRRCRRAFPPSARCSTPYLPTPAVVSRATTIRSSVAPTTTSATRRPCTAAMRSSISISRTARCRFSPYEGFNTPSITRNHNFLVSLTHVWSDRFVTQSKFAFSRVQNDQPLGDQPVTPSLYFRQNAKTVLLNRDVALPGYYPFSPSAAIPAGGPANNYQIYQDQTYTWGDHSFRFGGSFLRIQDNHFFGAFEIGRRGARRERVRRSRQPRARPDRALPRRHRSAG